MRLTLSIFACKLGGNLVCIGACCPLIPIGIPPRPLAPEDVEATPRGTAGADIAATGGGRSGSTDPFATEVGGFVVVGGNGSTASEGRGGTVSSSGLVSPLTRPLPFAPGEGGAGGCDSPSGREMFREARDGGSDTWAMVSVSEEYIWREGIGRCYRQLRWPVGSRPPSS
jgi:hypothetical protein